MIMMTSTEVWQSLEFVGRELQRLEGYVLWLERGDTGREAEDLQDMLESLDRELDQIAATLTLISDIDLHFMDEHLKELQSKVTVLDHRLKEEVRMSGPGYQCFGK